MNDQIDIKKINTHIQEIKLCLKALEELGYRFPALLRNTIRIRASLKMLELNVSDLNDLDLID